MRTDAEPRATCRKHNISYDPYSGRCWPCERAEIHEMARAELSEKRRQTPTVRLSADTDGPLSPENFPLDAKVEYLGQSWIFEVCALGYDDAYLDLTLDGGLPAEWLDETLLSAIATALGRRMMAIPRFERA